MSVSTLGDCARSLAAEVLQSTGILHLRVTGSSMLPTLWPGDLVCFESTSSIQPGVIVLFRRQDQFVIHRVVREVNAEGQSQFITRGDCMAQEDPPVPASDILGCLVNVRRGARTQASYSRISPWQKILGWLLCRSDLLHRLALRWHAESERDWASEAQNVAR